MSDGFSFRLQAGHAALADQVVRVSDPDAYAAAMESAIGVEKMAQIECGAVTLHTCFSTFVPAFMYRAADAAMWLNKVRTEPVPSSWVYRADLIEHFSCYNVYAVPETILHYLASRWGNVQEQHALTELVGLLPTDGDDAVIARWNGRQVEFCAALRGRLQIANQIDASTPHDAAYHIMNVYRQLNIDKRQIPLRLLDMPMIQEGQGQMSLRHLLGTWLQLV